MRVKKLTDVCYYMRLPELVSYSILWKKLGGAQGENGGNVAVPGINAREVEFEGDMRAMVDVDSAEDGVVQDSLERPDACVPIVSCGQSGEIFESVCGRVALVLIGVSIGSEVASLERWSSSYGERKATC